ncbi:YciI family protein [Agromyces sp. Marseille-Q5079]|uniref:YciI family protein n=1 Tax=Agromyces sp. Marseille-Q5079 TaxID=3439059 RepID=UPI003D9C96F5
MRYLCMMKSTDENGETPPAMYAAMAEYDRWGREAGVLIDSQGLLPSSAGAIVSLADGRIKAVDGPFTEAKELVGGYAIVEVRTHEEALELARRLMQIHVDHWPGFVGSVEIRQIAEY